MSASAALIALTAATGDAIVDTASAREPTWVAGVLRGVAPALTTTGFGVAMLTATCGYVGALLGASELRPRWLWLAILVTNATLLLAPPLLSSDVFGYIAYARLGVVHHLNPYLLPPAAAPHDPVLPLVFWQHQTSPYGPLFTLLGYPLAPLGPSATLWSLKAITAAASIGTAAVIWRAAERIGAQRARATVLVALNPLLLVYAVGGGHNDVLVMLLLASGAALLAAGRSSGTALLVAASATKLSGAIALPFALVGTRQRRSAATTALIALAIAIAITVAAFGLHIFDQVTSIATGDSYLIDYSGPDLLGRLLGAGVTSAIRTFALAAFVAVAGWQLGRTWRGANWVVAAGWTSLAALLCVPSLTPWYTCWLLPLAALGRNRRLTAATILFTAAMVITYLPLIGRPTAP